MMPSALACVTKDWKTTSTDTAGRPASLPAKERLHTANREPHGHSLRIRKSRLIHDTAVADIFAFV
jgi:hypothetical protein